MAAPLSKIHGPKWAQGPQPSWQQGPPRKVINSMTKANTRDPRNQSYLHLVHLHFVSVQMCC
ncbi:hypothetical protein E2C01_046605 [Portunus trituberculatus]|uniref:Uncharacterized protein n=1 Tax=Portunus trituberculatus TaxID=210409 RepID=A0A5B7G591_PORTR|nr:hypothetical protein [Portunus trituberculatus]